MGFREPLDISGYVAALGDNSVFGGGPKPPLREYRPEPIDHSRPYKASFGPADCSTCGDLVVRPIYDVNHYYRSLGIGPPYRPITRRDLMKAYQAKSGQRDTYLTQVFRYLLDPKKRRAYDAAPFGEPFLDDIQQELLKRNSKREAARRSARGVPTTGEVVLDEWDMRLIDDEREPDLVPPPPMRHDALDPPESTEPPWQWNYWLWGSHCRDTAKLSVWQSKLVSEFRRHGILFRFCVGYFGRKRSDSEWITGETGPHLVLFLREDVEPTDELAAAVVAYVLAEHTDEEVRTRMAKEESSPRFGRGGAAAKEEAKKQGQFAKIRFLSLQDKETVILRFVDDSEHWIYTRQHSFVPTKPAPEDATADQKKNWPKHMGAVCRHDEAFKGIYEDCYICDHMEKEDGKPYTASLRLWARAVKRDEVLGTEEMVEQGLIKQRQIGKRVGLIDAEVEEVETDEEGNPKGKPTKRKDVILVNMGMKNFFGALQGAYEIYGTVLDRDYAVTRDGSGTETDYAIVPLEPLRSVCPDCDGSGKVNEKACRECDGSGQTVFTLENEEIRKQYTSVVDMEKFIGDQASDDRYARFFDLTKKVKAKKATKAKGKAVDDDGDDDAADEIEEASPPSGVDPEQMAAMRERVKRGSGGARKPAPAEEEETEDAPVGAINFSG